jgi:hypothetical protein
LALVLMMVLMLDSYKICAMEMHLVSSLESSLALVLLMVSMLVSDLVYATKTHLVLILVTVKVAHLVTRLDLT